MNPYLARRRLMTAGGAKFETVQATFSVSGGMEDTAVVVDGKQYRLLKITKSGVLNFASPVNGFICLVGGGGNGAPASYYAGGGGGGGHMTHIYTFDKLKTLNFSIGAANRATSVSGDANGNADPGAVGSSANNGTTGGAGGSGGGGGGKFNGSSSGGTGDGKGKYPFGITSLGMHCAGGGGGGLYYYESYYELDGVTPYEWEWRSAGGTGGSNGSNGTGSGGYNSNGGTGGNQGGGAGGKGEYSGINGGNASFYGSGGGGGGYYYYEDGLYYYYTDQYKGTGGSGYQGVAYVIDGLFPANV